MSTLAHYIDAQLPGRSNRRGFPLCARIDCELRREVGKAGTVRVLYRAHALKLIPPMRTLSLVALAAGLTLLTATAAAETVFGLTSGNRLFSFDSLTPGTITAVNNFNPISGLPPNEQLLAIDFRSVATNSPAAALNGVLYALGDTHHLYTINTTSGAATLVPGAPFPLSGVAIGMDFNPVPDLLRVVSDSDENFRLNPNTGAVAATDTALAFVSGDPNFGVNPSVVAAAYTNNFGGAPLTTLYGIDYTADALVRQGGVNGTPSPNTGQLTTIGALGFDTTNDVGFDISGLTGLAYASLTPVVGPLDIASKLYAINLATGASTLVGPIGAAGGPGAFITLDIAAPVGTPVPEPGALGMLAFGLMALAGRRRCSSQLT